MSGTKNEVGHYFAAPLLGGGYAFGYFTYVDGPHMLLCAVHDLISDTPDLPENIDDVPLIIQDLQIGGGEFSLKPRQAAEFGEKWIRLKHKASTPARPRNTRFLMGPRGAEKVIDLTDESYERQASEAERKTLPRLGHAFPPTTTNTIEVAIRRIDIDPDDFYPEDFPRH